MWVSQSLKCLFLFQNTYFYLIKQKYELEIHDSERFNRSHNWGRQNS